MRNPIYQGNETFQLLVSSSEAAGIVAIWEANAIATDLCLRRARTRGCVVIETTDVLFANGIRQAYPRCQVNIRRL